MCVFVCVCVCAQSAPVAKWDGEGSAGAMTLRCLLSEIAGFFLGGGWSNPSERATCVASVAPGAPLAPPQCRLWVICAQLCGLTVRGQR